MINYHKWLHLRVMLISFLFFENNFNYEYILNAGTCVRYFGLKKCLFQLGTLVVCIKQVDMTNKCKKKKNKTWQSEAWSKTNLTLGKKQMEKNLGKDICRMKSRRWTATIFMAFLLYQMSNTLMQSSLHLASLQSDNRCVQLFSP